MAKRLSAKTGEYQDKQSGQTKGEYTQVGVILSNDNGEYVLLDPSVSLAGVLAKQNVLALNQGKNQRDNVMCGIYDESQQASAPQNNQAPQQQAPSQVPYNQQPQFNNQR